MAACDYQCPQKWRKRVILVATDHTSWSWPAERPWKAGLQSVLDPPWDSDDHKRLPNKSKHNRPRKFVKKALKNAMATAGEKKQGQA